MASYALFRGPPGVGRPLAAVLAETRRPRAEPWMDPMIAARVAADRRIGHGEALLALVARAVSENAIVVFSGD
jgi:hypothetical protein